MKKNKKSKKELDAYKRGFEDGFKNCYSNVGETFEDLFNEMHKFIKNVETMNVEDLQNIDKNQTELM
jgi:hypothetical protein